MGFTLKDLVAGSGVDLLPSDEEVTKERELKHRNRTVLERPKEEYSLKAIYEEDFVPKKKQTDPTPDLVHLIGSLRLVCRYKSGMVRTYKGLLRC